MFCTNCGKKLSDDALVCNDCGAPSQSSNTNQVYDFDPVAEPQNSSEEQTISEPVNLSKEDAMKEDTSGPNSIPYGNNNQNHNSSNNYTNNPYSSEPQPSTTADGFAIASIVLGSISLVCSCIPFISIITSIIGLILGILGLKSTKRGLSIAGIVLCGIFIAVSLFSIILVIIGVMNSSY